jgi:hypothetical protein
VTGRHRGGRRTISALGDVGTRRFELERARRRQTHVEDGLVGVMADECFESGAGRRQLVARGGHGACSRSNWRGDRSTGASPDIRRRARVEQVRAEPQQVAGPHGGGSKTICEHAGDRL